MGVSPATTIGISTELGVSDLVEKSVTKALKTFVADRVREIKTLEGVDRTTVKAIVERLKDSLKAEAV